MGQVFFIEDLNILKCRHLETMCTQLRTLRIGSYPPACHHNIRVKVGRFCCGDYT